MMFVPDHFKRANVFLNDIYHDAAALAPSCNVAVGVNSVI